MNPSETGLSVIVPAYNEAECLQELVGALRQTLLPLAESLEILLVDDASTDETPRVIEALCAAYPEVRGLRHKRNCGQSAAVATGLRCAKGRLLVTLDADMQNPPSEIPRLLAHLTPETDAVCGVRSERNDPALKKAASTVANAFRNRITGVPVQDAGCGMRLIRRSAVAELPVFNGLHRFITTFLKLQGLQVLEIPIAHRPRYAGRSKYGIHDRLWRGIADCLAIRWYARRVVPARRESVAE